MRQLGFQPLDPARIGRNLLAKKRSKPRDDHKRNARQ